MKDKCSWVEGEFIGCKESKKEWDSEPVSRSLEGYVSDGLPNFGGNFIYCPFCGASLSKPVVIKVGMFGKFSDDNGDPMTYRWDILERISDGMYITYGTTWYCFTPGLPQGFNDNGTPKENL